MLYNIPIFVGVNMEPETVRRLAEIPNIIGIKDEAGINPTQVTDFFLAQKMLIQILQFIMETDVMLLPRLCRELWDLCLVEHRFLDMKFVQFLMRLRLVRMRKQKKLLNRFYRFCKSTGQNGRILPNSIMRPAIEAVSGIKLGNARLPLAPPTDEEMKVTLGILKDIGKI